MTKPFVFDDSFDLDLANSGQDRVQGPGVNGPNSVNVLFDNNRNTTASSDFDPDAGDSIDVFSVNGDSSAVGTEVTLDSGAILQLNSDGTFVYQENDAFTSLKDGEVGTDSFTYTVIDNINPTESDEATVTINITGENDAPTPVADSFTTLEDDDVSGNVLDNDDDPDGDSLEVTRFRITDNGDGAPIGGNGFTDAGDTRNGNDGLSLTVNEDGSFDFDPGNFYNGPLSLGDTKDLVVQYQVKDNEGGFTLAEATITIVGQDETPTAGPNNVEATIFVDPNTGNIGGNAFDEGTTYTGDLFSNTDFTAESPSDIIAGTDDDDAIWGGRDGNDLIDGKAGNDEIGYGNSGSVSRVFAGEGDDLVYSTEDGPQAGGPTGEAVINLEEGNDIAWVGTANSVIRGGEGNDQAGVLSGNHTFFGGQGEDQFYGQKDAEIGGTLDVDLGGGNDRFFIVGGSTADATVVGGAGNDAIYSGEGDDTLTGGTGNDFLYAGAGNNTVNDFNGRDVFGLTAGDGVTTINGFSAMDDLFALTNGLTFEDLSFSTIGMNTQINSGTDVLAVVNGSTEGQLTDQAPTGFRNLFFVDNNANFA